MHYLELISGPFIGAVIGYFTNWIAVRMLFHPLKPVMIGKYTLPFTPGIIPKRKDALAKALGTAVGESLFTKEDIQKVFLEENTKASIVNGLLKHMKSVGNENLEELLIKFAKKETIERKKEDIAELVTAKIKLGILSLDMGQLIAEGGSSILKEKLQKGMLSFFLNDDFINSLAEPIGKQVENYIEEHGHEIIYPMVEKQMDEILEMKVEETVHTLDIDLEKARKGIESVYDILVSENIEKLLCNFDIAGSVQKKVEEMDLPELEKLVLSVMKKEMDALVNLGALIGGLIGVLNIFI